MNQTDQLIYQSQKGIHFELQVKDGVYTIYKVTSYKDYVTSSENKDDIEMLFAELVEEESKVEYIPDIIDRLEFEQKLQG